MKPEERIETVLGGGKPDRVPFVPLVYYFAAQVAGVSNELFLTDKKIFRHALDICYQRAGPWDAIYTLPFTFDAPDYDITWGAGLGMKPGLACGGDCSTRVLEAIESEPLMHEDDYERIIAFKSYTPAHPLLGFMVELISRYRGKPPDAGLWLNDFMRKGLRLGVGWLGESRRWRRRGMGFFVSFSLEAPFDVFSMARGLVGFSIDLRRRPDEVREASLKLAKSLAHVALLACRAIRTNRFLLLLHRSSNDFISPEKFALYAFPSIRYIACFLSSRGVYFGMHNDGNWDRNLEVLSDLPENTFFQFDGRTDIVRARKILGNKFTIMGDVPAAMLAFGLPEEVTCYCQRLIEEVGADGRFILSSGCEVPQNAGLENVRAMVRAALQHGYD